MTKIAIIDHGAGNLVSVANALTIIGETPCIVTDPTGLDNVDAIVLPGVGATNPAMRQLSATGLDEALSAWEKPMLGVCVGLQLMFDRSDEDGQPCLGLMAGTVEELDAPLLPHMGWNDVMHRDDVLFADIPQGEPFYFVHSYAPVPDSADMIVATANHGGTFVAAARSGERVGVQFHPERSGQAGLRLLANFASSVRRVA